MTLLTSCCWSLCRAFRFRGWTCDLKKSNHQPAGDIGEQEIEPQRRSELGPLRLRQRYYSNMFFNFGIIDRNKRKKNCIFHQKYTM